MRFSQEFIEKVRDANNLAEVISQYTELRRNGDRLMGRCPFPDHAEKTPSFSVSETKQLYHCFGCKKSGNLFTFLETFKGMNFRESVEYLAKRASIPIPVDESRKNDKRSDEREQMLKVNRLAGAYFHQQLPRLTREHPAIVYLRKRGLSAEIVEKFKIGVALEPWEGLVTVLQQKRIPLPLAETLGLIKRKKDPTHGSGFFDLFRERIIFPIFSPSDELLGFGGRTYKDAVPKYLNSPETPVFHKGRVFYGLHETGKFIRSEDHVVIVEGYMDALALYAAGIKNVVAILGTAFTPDHAKLLRRYTENVTMLLDGDEAGQNAAERSLPILLEAGLLAKGCFLPDKLDPDDFIKAKGVEALREELGRAPELFNLVLGRWMRNYRGSASEKVKLVDELYPVLKVMQNHQLRELYLSEVSLRLDVDAAWVKRAFAAAAQKEREKEARSAAVRSPVQGIVTSSNEKPTGGAAQGQAGRISARPSSPENMPFGSNFRGISGPGRPESVSPPAANSRAGVGPAHEARSLSIRSQGPTRVQGDGGIGVPTSATTSEGEGKPALISVKGAPRDEAFVLSLALHNETLLNEAREAGVLNFVSHDGVRKALSLAFEMYGQKPASFDKLAASLASQLDQPSIVTCSLEVISRPGAKTDSPDVEMSTDGTEESRLMTDYINALKKRYLRDQAKALANRLRDQANPETLEQFMNIQKVRHSLDRE